MTEIEVTFGVKRRKFPADLLILLSCSLLVLIGNSVGGAEPPSVTCLLTL